jgi:chemotaxis protein methyltransferase WspC
VREELLPANPTTPLRMLSVPCATGEEPYTIVMTLLDAGVPEERFRIEAVDICERLLVHARRGSYGRGSFRGADLQFRTRYFDAEESRYVLYESVRRLVRFQQGNLLALDFLPGGARYDVIFCRNVLIYFDRPTQDRALAVLSRLLTPNGVLFVGPAESGVVIEHDFRSAKMPLAFAFRKGNAESAGKTGKAGKAGTHPGTQGTVPYALPALVPSPVQHPGIAVARALPLPPLQVVPPRASHTQTARPPDRPDRSGRPVELDEAQALADQGRFDDAANRCDACMQKHGPSADAFFLLGLVRDASGRASEAEASYRKALYLDQHHEHALLHLALLLERQGRPEARVLRQRLQRVVAILKAAGPDGKRT